MPFERGAAPLFRGERWLNRTLIGVVLAYVGILLAAPCAALARGAFAGGGAVLWRELARPDVLSAFRLTLALALGAVALNTVFGVLTAWVLVRHSFPGRRMLNALVDMPFAVSPVVAGYMLILLFGRGGWLAGWVEWSGFRVVFSWPGMLLATVFVTMPFVVREVMPVLREFGAEPEEAAATLGAGPWRIFWRVTLPSVRWGLLYGVALTLARALGEFGAVYVVSGAVQGRTETAPLFVFRALDERLTVAAYGVSLVLALLSFSLITALGAYQKREEEKISPRGPGAEREAA
ncbi:MAG TPA: sulfate ABC transporter permease subunit [Elusimicrobiota bacterium]|nr:sulfate ABC transporter permease subunit [Elusimicrobiota bacterium]